MGLLPSLCCFLVGCIQGLGHLADLLHESFLFLSKHCCLIVHLLIVFLELLLQGRDLFKMLRALCTFSLFLFSCGFVCCLCAFYPSEVLLGFHFLDGGPALRELLLEVIDLPFLLSNLGCLALHSLPK